MLRNRWILFLLLFAFRSELFSQTEVMFSHQGGFYDEPFALSLECSDLDCHIRYTTNGGIPTENSKCYGMPLFLDESLYSISDIYTLPIAPVFESFVPDSVQHAIVIRAAAFDGNGERVSDVVTKTYLIRALGCDHHGLAVVSVCADSLSLFDYDTGIFVPGVYLIQNILIIQVITTSEVGNGSAWPMWSFMSLTILASTSSVVCAPMVIEQERLRQRV